MPDRRIYAGYYKRYDGKLIYVVTRAEDADSGEDVVIWTPFTYSEPRQYFTMSKKSFCEYVVVDGKRQAKFKPAFPAAPSATPFPGTLPRCPARFAIFLFAFTQRKISLEYGKTFYYNDSVTIFVSYHYEMEAVMARNTARDEREAGRRKKQLLEAGFDLFSRHGIEAVSLQMVADAADVGIATLYKYYQNKLNLVVAISASVWETVWKEVSQSVGLEALERRNAYQLVELYCDSIIRLYEDRPEILRFSANYKSYICREGASEEQLAAQLDVLKPIDLLFHRKYEAAKADGSIRTDLPEQELFTTLTLTMLGMAERYAQGLVWANNRTGDHGKELSHLKDMLLTWAGDTSN